MDLQDLKSHRRNANKCFWSLLIFFTSPGWYCYSRFPELQGIAFFKQLRLDAGIDQLCIKANLFSADVAKIMIGRYCADHGNTRCSQSKSWYRQEDALTEEQREVTMPQYVCGTITTNAASIGVNVEIKQNGITVAAPTATKVADGSFAYSTPVSAGSGYTTKATCNTCSKSAESSPAQTVQPDEWQVIDVTIPCS